MIKIMLKCTMAANQEEAKYESRNWKDPRVASAAG